ncbi:MAG: IclR family transcriptional regulator [Pseudomonadota bacterium]
MERPDTIASKDRQFVTALARGLEILRAFRPGEVALGNQELSERTGLPKPTVSRLTSTLRELGYLTLHGRTGAYALGPGVLALGYAMIAGLEMRERARPLMEQLARDANATVALGARDRLSVIYLDVARSDSTVTLSMGVGARIPLATSAMGRAVLAALPEGERQYFLDAIKEREPAEYARIKAGVERAVEELATQGFVTSIGEWRDDVHAVAAPVISPDGERLYAINCGGPSFMVSKEALTERFGPELAKVARDLSAPIEALKSGVSDL